MMNRILLSMVTYVTFTQSNGVEQPDPLARTARIVFGWLDGPKPVKKKRNGTRITIADFASSLLLVATK